MRVDPITPTLKALRTKRLNLNYYQPLSSFAFNLNLRRYFEAITKAVDRQAGAGAGAGADGVTSDGQGLTLVHFSAQLEPFLTPNTP